MLSIHPAVNQSYYTKLAQAGYYLDAPEPSGFWYGKGATSLGLTGEVLPEIFSRVFSGHAPHSETLVPLVQNANSENRANAWDLTFSLPKELSQFWALAEPVIQEKISALHKEAVCESIDFIQERGAICRRGRGGAIKEHGVGLVCSLFEHASSRSGDMQIHTHALLMNLGTCEDGKTRALESREFYRYKMATGAYYRGRIAEKFSKEFDISFSLEGRAMKVDGRQEDYYKHTSKRRSDIEIQLSELGLSGGRASAKAAVSTREKKDLATTREELCKLWQQEAQEKFNLSCRSLYQGFARAAKEKTEKTSCDSNDIINDLFQKYTIFDRYQLTQSICEKTQAMGLSKEQISHLETEILQAVVPLGRQKDRDYYTTRQTLSLEREFIERAEKLSKTEDHLLSYSTLESIIQGEKTLSPEQEMALLHVLDTGALKIVEGVAGAGKTTFLKQATTAWQESGYRVIGLALSANAATNLSTETGILESFSIAKFKFTTNPKDFDEKTVFVVDEAAMVGTQDLNFLLKVGEDRGAKNVWVGDRNQLQSIDPGGAFAGAADSLGVAELKTIYRQREESERQIVYSASAGMAGQAVRELEEKGRISYHDDRKELHRSVIDKWIKNTDTLILTSTRQEAEVINRMCQNELVKQNLVTREAFIETKDALFFKGDRVIITRNNTKLKVQNGMRGVISELDPNKGNVRIDLEVGGSRELNLKTYGHVALSYAITTHKAQGRTVDNTLVVVDSSMASKESFYVQVSRHRDSVELFVDKSAFIGSQDVQVSLVKAVEKVTKEDLASKFHSSKQKARNQIFDRVLSILADPSKKVPVVEQNTKESSPFVPHVEQSNQLKERDQEQVITAIIAPVEVKDQSPKTITASEALTLFQETVLGPAQERYRTLEEQMKPLSEYFQFRYRTDEGVKDEFFGRGRYQDLKEREKRSQHHLARHKKDYEELIALGERKGWFYRKFSSDYKQKLVRQNKEVEQEQEYLNKIQSQKGEMDNFLGSAEGQARVKAYLDKYDRLSEKNRELWAEINALNMPELNRNYRFLRELDKNTPVTLVFNPEKGEREIDFKRVKELYDRHTRDERER